MEDQRFDELTKRLCTTRLTRLSVLRGLAAGAVAVVTGAKVGSSRTVSAAAGTCREVGHPCQGNQNCCPNIESCEVVGPGSAKRCANKTDCGAITQPCCNGDCQAGLECDPETNICVDPDTECGGVGQECCEPNDTCDPGGVCDGSQGENGTCVECGTEGKPCCENDTCNTGELTCATGTCVECGDVTEPCCEDEFCNPGGICNNNGICVPPAANCGQLNQPCCDGNQCAQGRCINGTCQNPGPAPATSCTSGAQCPAVAPFCNTGTGQCVSIGGLRCKSGETAQKCCNRSVKKGCNRKQQTAHAKKNCLKKGEKRCKKLLAGIA